MDNIQAAGTSDKKHKSSMLDDNLGNGILSSWKSMSVTKDTEDFNLEPMGKPKKKDFSFDKLDMDFDIGGGFGNISSFKMDMSDLDFSFSPKKNKKLTETAEVDSGKVKFQGKEDRFNFSFDFNSLDNFDVDATLGKVDTLSSKQKDNQMLASDRTDIQVSEIPDNEVTNADIINKPKRGQSSEIVAAGLVQVLADDGDTSMTDNHPLRNKVSSDTALQLDAETFPDEAVHSAKETNGDHSSLPAEQPLVSNLDVQSIPAHKLGISSLTDPLVEGCSRETVTANVGGEQSICYEKLVALGVEAINKKSPECVPPQIRESPKDNNDGNENMSDKSGKVPNIDVKEVYGQGSELQGVPKFAQIKASELSKDYIDENGSSENTSGHVEEYSGSGYSNDAFIASSVTMPNREIETQVPPLSNREQEVIGSYSGKETESKVVRSNLFGKSDDTNIFKHGSSNFTKPKSLNTSTVHTASLPEMSDDNVRGKHVGVTVEAGFLSHKNVTKVESKLLQNQRKLITAKEIRLPISSSISKTRIDKKEPLTSEKINNVTSITDFTQAIRPISIAKDKSLPIISVTRNFDLSDLKNSRCSEGKKLQSFSATTLEIKSFKDLRQKDKVVESVISKITGPNLNEKQMPGTPTLKRKQAPTGGLIHQIPLKRLSQSPKDNSNNVLDTRIHNQVQHKNNIMDVSMSNSLLDLPRIRKIDAPEQLNFSALEISSEMGNYEMVEKAASYGKDLDYICNMIKKKNEEAKELLVRAVVNNNNLLLLNNPMHDAKIHSVQKLANRLMAMEIVHRQR